MGLLLIWCSRDDNAETCRSLDMDYFARGGTDAAWLRRRNCHGQASAFGLSTEVQGYVHVEEQFVLPKPCEIPFTAQNMITLWPRGLFGSEYSLNLSNHLNIKFNVKYLCSLPTVK